MEKEYGMKTEYCKVCMKFPRITKPQKEDANPMADKAR
jgi:hypothetical protein